MSSYLEGIIIEINGEGELEPRNPQLLISKLSGSLEEQIQLMLDEQVNPMLASHGGNVMLEGIKDSTAYVRLGGGCQGLQHDRYFCQTGSRGDAQRGHPGSGRSI